MSHVTIDIYVFINQKKRREKYKGSSISWHNKIFIYNMGFIKYISQLDWDDSVLCYQYHQSMVHSEPLYFYPIFSLFLLIWFSLTIENVSVVKFKPIQTRPF